MKGPSRGLGRVVVATGVSQAISALGLIVLQLAGPPASDIVSFGVQVGGTSLTGVVFGVVYNMTIGRPGFRAWRLSAMLAASLSVLTGVAAGIWFGLAQGSSVRPGVVALVIIAFGLGGGALAIAGVASVRLACLGSPVPFAAVFVLPNLGLLVGAALALVLGGVPPYVMPCAMWCLGSLAALVVYLRLPIPAPVTGVAGGVQGGEAGHALALGIGVVASSVLPLLYISAMAALPPGQLGIVYLLGRIGNSLVGLGVNSVLLVRFNWREVVRLSSKAADIGAAAATALLTAGWIAGELRGFPVVGYGLVGAGWIVLLSLAAVVGREANALRRSKAIMAKVSADTVLGAVAALVLFSQPSVSGYFGAFSLAAGVTVTVLSAGRGRPRTVVLGLVCTTISFLIIARGF